MARIAKLSNSELKSTVLSENAKVTSRIPVECDREGVEESYLDALRDDPNASPVLVECAETEIPKASDELLVRMNEDLPAYQRFLLECDESGYYEYARQAVGGGQWERCGGLRGQGAARAFRSRSRFAFHTTTGSSPPSSRSATER